MRFSISRGQHVNILMFSFSKGQDPSSELAQGCALRGVERARAQRIKQGDQLPDLGRHGQAVFRQRQAAFDHCHGGIVVSSHGTIIEAGIAQGGVHPLVTEDGLHGEHGCSAVEEQGGAGVAQEPL